jgi:hypothetical protein
MKRGRKPKQLAKEQQKQEELDARLDSSTFKFADFLTSPRLSPIQKNTLEANESSEEVSIFNSNQDTSFKHERKKET